MEGIETTLRSKRSTSSVKEKSRDEEASDDVRRVSFLFTVSCNEWSVFEAGRENEKESSNREKKNAGRTDATCDVEIEWVPRRASFAEARLARTVFQHGLLPVFPQEPRELGLRALNLVREVVAAAPLPVKRPVRLLALAGAKVRGVASRTQREVLGGAAVFALVLNVYLFLVVCGHRVRSVIDPRRWRVAV
jgi:hypothetical protein